MNIVKKTKAKNSPPDNAADQEYAQVISIFEGIDEVIYVSDPKTYEILYANRAIEKDFGYVLGKQCYEVFQGLKSPCPFCTNNIIFGENLGESHIWEFQNLKTRRWYRCIDRAIPWSKGRMVRCEMAIDITDRKTAEEALNSSNQRWQRNLEETVNALFMALEKRDPYTAGHERRVARLSQAIGAEIGLDRGQIEGMRVIGFLHDIGKIVVPSEILSKPAKLSENEYKLMKTHSQVGYDILKKLEFPWPVAQIVLQHHERLDGSGYPIGLTGKDIGLESRIIAVADVVEAMSSHRPYRAALGVDKALEEITQNSGTLYDKEVGRACVKVFAENKFCFDQNI
jgi:putative nucleotidyltransferase with HDIG domain/PAS domain S-box-containing protein